jgi:hypothetical protein
MPPPPITAEDIARWLTPSQAVNLVDAAYENKQLSTRALLDRLRGEMVQAVAAYCVVQLGGGASRRLTIAGVPATHWEKMFSSDQFWITGQFDCVARPQGFSQLATFRYFDVRFEPEDVRAIIAHLSIPDTIQAPSEPEPAQKGPPVSEAHLQAWFDVYRKVYGGSPGDTLENALKSARGMFHDRFVSRDRVRDLAGGRTPGRKPRKDQ